MLYEVVSVSTFQAGGSAMTEKKSSTNDDKKHPESENDGLTTLFSSDNTELTDFTEKVNRAILGDEQPQDIEAKADQAKDKTNSKPTLISSAKSNVVNLFGPK